MVCPKYIVSSPLRKDYNISWRDCQYIRCKTSKVLTKGMACIILCLLQERAERRRESMKEFCREDFLPKGVNKAIVAVYENVCRNQGYWAPNINHWYRYLASIRGTAGGSWPERRNSQSARNRPFLLSLRNCGRVYGEVWR